MEIRDDLKRLGDLVVAELQSIIKLNGAYRSGRLFDSFKVDITTKEDQYEIQISNTAPYAKFLSRGTREWLGESQSRSPVVRKYQFPKRPQGYPAQRSGYPFNKKGIEPIDLINPIRENIEMLTDYLNGVFVKEYTSQVIEDFKATLNK